MLSFQNEDGWIDDLNFMFYEKLLSPSDNYDGSCDFLAARTFLVLFSREWNL
jgi:hypothetical protein